MTTDGPFVIPCKIQCVVRGDGNLTFLPEAPRLASAQQCVVSLGLKKNASSELARRLWSAHRTAEIVHTEGTACDACAAFEFGMIDM